MIPISMSTMSSVIFMLQLLCDHNASKIHYILYYVPQENSLNNGDYNVALELLFLTKELGLHNK